MIYTPLMAEIIFLSHNLGTMAEHDKGIAHICQCQGCESYRKSLWQRLSYHATQA